MSPDAVATHLATHYSLTGRNAVVTGGTAGIGRAIVLELASLGASVLTCGRRGEAVAELVAECAAKGLDVRGVVADVASEEGRAELMAEAASTFDSTLHVLVNNVGTNIRKPSVDYTGEEVRFLLSTNVESAFRLTQAAHPLLAAGGAGVPGGAAVVLLTSVAGGPTAMRSGAIYAMTKAALNQATRNWACEWAVDGIRTVAVAPYYIETPLTAPVLSDPVFRAEALSRTPMRRVGSPEEVARVVAFVAGPAASYLTGTTIPVDGGYSVMGLY